MEFNEEDIGRLYGRFFFLLEGDRPSPDTATPKKDTEIAQTENDHVREIEASPTTVDQKPEKEPIPATEEKKEVSYEAFIGMGSMADWRLKKQSEVALIVLKNEFDDSEAMANLKNLMVAAGIDLSKIGFGIIESQQNHWNLSDMPVPKGIIFADFSQKLPSPISWKGKEFFPAAPIAKISKDERYGLAMDRLLRRIREDL